MHAAGEAYLPRNPCRNLPIRSNNANALDWPPSRQHIIMAHRLAPEVESELDDSRYYIAKESGSIEIADRLIDSITAVNVELGFFISENLAAPSNQEHKRY